MTEHQAEANKAIVHRLYEVFRAGDVAALGEVLAEDFVNHNPQTTNGLAASQALFSQVGSIDAEIHRMVGGAAWLPSTPTTQRPRAMPEWTSSRSRTARSSSTGTSSRTSPRRQPAARTCSAS